MGDETTKTVVAGEAKSLKPAARPAEESDGKIVPMKRANKGDQSPAESVEGSAPTERNPEQEAAGRMQSRETASNGLERVRQKAGADKTIRFNNLFQHR
jgi:RNA-directed DNA polymerase